MQQFLLIGPVDKRPITYPLLKVLSYLGKTLVVADDGNYRRFADNYESEFELGNIDFSITPVVTEEVFKQVNETHEIYDYVVYITNNELPQSEDYLNNIAKIIHCRGVDKGFISKANAQVLEDLPSEKTLTAYVTYSNVEDKRLLKVTPNKGTLSYVSECEDKKEFVDIKDSMYATLIYTFFEKELHLPKETIAKLLKRKG